MRPHIRFFNDPLVGVDDDTAVLDDDTIVELTDVFTAIDVELLFIECAPELSTFPEGISKDLLDGVLDS